jgi:hypothetical protein
MLRGQGLRQLLLGVFLRDQENWERGGLFYRVYIVYKIDKIKLIKLIFINKYIKFFSPLSTITTSL